MASLDKIMTIANPIYPLKFERFGEGDFKADRDFVESLAQLGRSAKSPLVGLEMKLDELEFTSIDIFRAESAARKAYNASNPVVEATRILSEISESSPEAYNVLAMFDANTYQEALEYYNTAVKLSPAATFDFTVGCSDGTCWMYNHLRSYFRAVHGQANSLRKMGRYKEALEKYHLLTNLDSNLYSFSSYANYRCHVPEIYLKLGEEANGIKYMKQERNIHCYGRSSSSAAWNWSKALMDYRLQKVSGFNKEFFEAKDDSRDYTRFGRPSDGQILRALSENGYILEYLTGKRTLPDVKIPFTMGNESSLTNAAVYCYSSMDLWKDTPGAIEWAAKNARTLFCSLILKNAKFLQNYGIPCTMEQFELLVGEGIYLEGRFNSNGRKLMHEAIGHSSKAVEILLKAGAKPCPDFFRLDLQPQPLHIACFYDKDPKIVKLLCKAGADPSAKRNLEYNPLQMAAEQGNVYALDAAFNCMPEDKQKDPKLLDGILRAIFTDTCYECVIGMKGMTCERCRLEGVPHSPNVDFTGCITVAMSTGHIPSVKIMKYTKSKKNKKFLYDFLLEAKKRNAEGEPLKYKKDVACSTCRREDVKTKKCSACLKVRYCSQECQRKDWKLHKKDCRG